jgi:Ala-tRNA(Pro) deacylase
VAVAAQKRVNIKALSALIGAGHLSFGSPERLKKYLGVDPGSVTVLATINDPEQVVELIFDEILWQEEVFQFHPLVNTSTLLIARDSLARYFKLTGHEIRLLNVPSQE